MYTVDDLRDNLANLPAKDHGFADNLITAANRRGYLSEKQAYWVDQLTKRATGKIKPKAFAVNADGLTSFLNRAKSAGLKHPKVKLQDADGNPVRLHVAGDRSRTPGAIQITDGGPYGDNKYFGRIHEGQFRAGRDITDGVIEVINALVEDPEGVASEYGKLTGECCFCSRPLSDEKSTAVGYGKVCSKKYGLPWG